MFPIVWLALTNDGDGLTATDIVAIIGAITVSFTSVIAAVGTVIVAVRTGAIKKTGEETQATGVETHDMANSQNDALRALVEKQQQEMHKVGLRPTTDDSLHHKRKGVHDG